MIGIIELMRLAYARLADARALHAAGRYDAAMYLSGYAVELALKARICQTLEWEGFPQTRREFEHLGSFKVHNLEALLRLSGAERRIRMQYDQDWREVENWEPALRYAPEGTANPHAAERVLASARQIVRAL